jgi:hypothetical protein
LGHVTPHEIGAENGDWLTAPSIEKAKCFSNVTGFLEIGKALPEGGPLVLKL